MNADIINFQAALEAKEAREAVKLSQDTAVALLGDYKARCDFRDIMRAIVLPRVDEKMRKLER